LSGRFLDRRHTRVIEIEGGISTGGTNTRSELTLLIKFVGKGIYSNLRADFVKHAFSAAFGTEFWDGRLHFATHRYPRLLVELTLL
jgi:hypothetical protein